MQLIIKFSLANLGVFLFSFSLYASTSSGTTSGTNLSEFMDAIWSAINSVAAVDSQVPQLSASYVFCPSNTSGQQTCNSNSCAFPVAPDSASLQVLCSIVPSIIYGGMWDDVMITQTATIGPQSNSAPNFTLLFNTIDQNLKVRGLNGPLTWVVMANSIILNPSYAIPVVPDIIYQLTNSQSTTDVANAMTNFENALSNIPIGSASTNPLTTPIDIATIDSTATQLGASSKVFPPLLATYVPQSIRSSTDITQRIPAIQQFQQIIWNTYQQAPNALLSAMQSTYASSSSTNIQNNFWDLVVPNLPAAQAVSIQSIAPAGWPVITTSVYSANTAMVTTLNGAYKIDQGATLEMLISLVNAALPSKTTLSLTNTWQAVATFVTNASCSATNSMSNCGKAVSAAQTAFGTALKNSTQSNPINGIAIWNALMPVTQLQGATITDPNEQALFVLLVPYASLVGQQIQNLLSQAYIYYQIEQLLAELAGITSPTLATYWSNIASVLPTTPLAGNSSSQINFLISQATKTLGADSSSSHAISSVPPSSNSQMMSNLLNFVSKLFSQINFQLGVSGSSYTSAQNAMTDLANSIATIPNLIAKAKTSKKMPAGATVANGGIYSGFAALLTAYSPTAGIQNPLMAALTYINNNL